MRSDQWVGRGIQSLNPNPQNDRIGPRPPCNFITRSSQYTTEANQISVIYIARGKVELLFQQANSLTDYYESWEILPCFIQL